MKKLFALLLAVLMTATLSVPALAATAIDGGGATSASDKDAGDYTIDVNGKYRENLKTVTDVISVDIAWDAMSFTYTANMGYNPGSHKNEAQSGAWSDNKAGITVTNHSNVDIDAEISYESIHDGNIKGYFYETETTPTGKTGVQTISLESAEGKTRNETDETLDRSPKGTVYFGIDGAGITEDVSNLGTITVKIAKQTWTEVSSQSELTQGGRLKLTDDIVASGAANAPLVVLEARSAIDLNGKTLSGSNMQSLIRVDAEACTIKNGTLKNTASGTGKVIYIQVSNITLRLEQCTLTAANNYSTALSIGMSSSTVIAKDCTFTGTVSNSGTLELSGNITLNNSTNSIGGSGTVKCLAGTYNFDPTDYVDTDTYTVTPNAAENPTSWTVTANA